MKEVNITIRVDARKYTALFENYEGTIEGFLESELAELYDEVVPPEESLGIEADIKAEEEDHAKNKFALICMKDKDDSFYIMTNDCKTFLDVAKRFAMDVYHDYPEWSIVNFKSSFGDYEEINEMAFNIMSKSCGTDHRIGIVASFNMDDNTLAVMTSQNPNFRVFDLDGLFAATTTVINNDHVFYCNESEDFEGQIIANECEISLDNQGESEDTGIEM